MRAFATVRALAVEHDVGVFGLWDPGAKAPTNDGIVAWEASQAFRERMDQLTSSSLKWLHDPTGHPSDLWYSEGIMAELARLIDELQARLVVVESLWLHRYIAPLRELGCRVVLNAHGIEGALYEELVANRTAPFVRMLLERTREVEARAFATADQVWVCSAHDVEVASVRYGRSAQLQVVPNGIELDCYGPPTPSVEHFTVAFTASFSYPPNEVAAQRLMTGIFPPLANRVSRARLALIGRDPTAPMQSASAQDSRIEVTGAVDDVVPYLQRANVMAVPLTEGHGTRFKVLEAFASQVPVVSTAKGVEGLDVEPGDHYLAAERDADFVEALELLARDPDLRTRLARRGLEAVRAGYSLAVVHERVTAALASVARPSGRGDYT